VKNYFNFYSPQTFKAGKFGTQMQRDEKRKATKNYTEIRKKRKQRTKNFNFMERMSAADVESLL
jgi:hypothetical protein